MSRRVHASPSGLISILLAVTIGTPLGAVAGYFGGRTDALLMRAIDVALAFPSVLSALLVSAAYRPSWVTVVIAVVVSRGGGSKAGLRLSAMLCRG